MGARCGLAEHTEALVALGGMAHRELVVEDMAVVEAVV